MLRIGNIYLLWVLIASLDCLFSWWLARVLRFWLYDTWLKAALTQHPDNKIYINNIITCLKLHDKLQREHATNSRYGFYSPIPFSMLNCHYASFTITLAWSEKVINLLPIDVVKATVLSIVELYVIYLTNFSLSKVRDFYPAHPNHYPLTSEHFRARSKVQRCPNISWSQSQEVFCMNSPFKSCTPFTWTFSSCTGSFLHIFWKSVSCLWAINMQK